MWVRREPDWILSLEHAIYGPKFSDQFILVFLWSMWRLFVHIVVCPLWQKHLLLRLHVAVLYGFTWGVLTRLKRMLFLTPHCAIRKVAFPGTESVLTPTSSSQWCAAVAIYFKAPLSPMWYLAANTWSWYTAITVSKIPPAHQLWSFREKGIGRVWQLQGWGLWVSFDCESCTF